MLLRCLGTIFIFMEIIFSETTCVTFPSKIEYSSILLRDSTSILILIFLRLPLGILISTVNPRIKKTAMISLSLPARARARKKSVTFIGVFLRLIFILLTLRR